jgi:hypothetical protein
MIDGPGAQPLPPVITEAAEVERIVSGELGGEGVGTQP